MNESVFLPYGVIVTSFCVCRHVGGILCCSGITSSTCVCLQLLCLDICSSRKAHDLRITLAKELSVFNILTQYYLCSHSVYLQRGGVISYKNDVIAPHAAAAAWCAVQWRRKV